MGIRPLEPVTSASYSLDTAKAATPIANYVLLTSASLSPWSQPLPGAR